MSFVPWLAGHLNGLVEFFFKKLVGGIPNGCNIQTARQMELHPDCVLETALSVMFSFMCTLFAMFFVGCAMIIVYHSLHLDGQLPPSPTSCFCTLLSHVFSGEFLFAAMRHPAYKHFLRLRVHSDGSGIDGYCIGIIDPYAAHINWPNWGKDPTSRPILVSNFHLIFKIAIEMHESYAISYNSCF